jgi:hypothetical protein
VYRQFAATAVLLSTAGQIVLFLVDPCNLRGLDQHENEKDWRQYITSPTWTVHEIHMCNLAVLPCEVEHQLKFIQSLLLDIVVTCVFALNGCSQGSTGG